MSANPAPGFEKHPEHRITLQPAGVRVRVKVNGESIADTREAMRLEESKYPPVYYVPRKDVKMERLSRTDHSTYCPFKGHASYFSVQGGPEHAAWSYEQPYDEMAPIREYLAFYLTKVEISTEGS